MPMLARALVLWLLTLSAARGEAIISITFGTDRLDIAPEQIVTVEAVFDQQVPYVAVTLVPELQFPLASLTLVHVGKQGAIRVCGKLISEPVLQSPVKSASFLITNGDYAETRRLAAILKARDCAPEATS
jgi:preprotein translocase subunit SecD